MGWLHRGEVGSGVLGLAQTKTAALLGAAVIRFGTLRLAPASDSIVGRALLPLGFDDDWTDLSADVFNGAMDESRPDDLALRQAQVAARVLSDDQVAKDIDAIERTDDMGALERMPLLDGDIRSQKCRAVERLGLLGWFRNDWLGCCFHTYSAD